MSTNNHSTVLTERFAFLFVSALGQARLVRVARLLLLFSIEGHFLSHAIPVGNSQHLFRCPMVLHGELADQRRVPESLLKEHHN
jgi:hypothetical protein